MTHSSQFNVLGFAVALLINVLVFDGGIVGLVRILRRMGFSGWWALMIMLWPFGLMILARAKWPAFDETSNWASAMRKPDRLTSYRHTGQLYLAWA